MLTCLCPARSQSRPRSPSRRPPRRPRRSRRIPTAAQLRSRRHTACSCQLAERLCEHAGTNLGMTTQQGRASTNTAQPCNSDAATCMQPDGKAQRCVLTAMAKEMDSIQPPCYWGRSAPCRRTAPTICLLVHSGRPCMLLARRTFCVVSQTSQSLKPRRHCPAELDARSAITPLESPSKRSQARWIELQLS